MISGHWRCPSAPAQGRKQAVSDVGTGFLSGVHGHLELVNRVERFIEGVLDAPGEVAEGAGQIVRFSFPVAGIVDCRACLTSEKVMAACSFSVSEPLPFMVVEKPAIA